MPRMLGDGYKWHIFQVITFAAMQAVALLLAKEADCKSATIMVLGGSNPSGGTLTIWIRSDIVSCASVSLLNSALSKRVEKFSDFDLQS